MIAIDQFEIEGTESPERDPELHALGLELYELQNRRKDLQKQERAKRDQVCEALHQREIASYHVDGIHLIVEATEKVSVMLDSADEGESDPAGD